MDEILIESLTKKDATRVAEIEKDCFSVPFLEDDILSYLKNPIWHFLVAKKDGLVLGYISFTIIIDECQIVNVATDPKYRKMGIGSKIIDSFLNYLKEKDVKSAYLEVRESNLPAINLYKKYGFLEAGVSKNHYSKPTENAILMNKEL